MKDSSIARSAKDLIIEKESVDFWQKRFKSKQKARQKAKSNVDKRTKLRDEEKILLTGFEEKRENFVYHDGTSYTVRWSALPRYLLLSSERILSDPFSAIWGNTP